MLKKIPKVEFIILFLIILTAGFLRLYRISETIMFQGDQGRDAIIAKKILIDGDLTLLGPVTSVGNMHLGPFYYYFMVPFLAITYPDPIGPAIGVALVGVITVYLVYKFSKEAFGIRVGMISSFLYAISSVAVLNSRFSWNPNLVPFFSMLIMLGLYQIAVLKNYRKIIWVFVFFGILIQLHYMALLMFPIIVSVIIWQYFVLKNDSGERKLNSDLKKKRLKIIKHTLIGSLLALIISLPLIIFDFRHDFINWKAFGEFMSSEQEHIRPALQFVRVLKETEGRTYKIIPQLLGSSNGIVDRVVVISILTSIIFIIKKKIFNIRELISFKLVLIWVGFAIFGTSFYNSGIYDHYLGFVMPAVFILVGVMIAELCKWGKLAKLLAAFGLGWVVVINFKSMPTFAEEGVSLNYYKKISAVINEMVSEGSRYNVVLVSNTRDYKAMNYRYFLEVSDKPPLSYEVYDNLDELFVIVELPYKNPFEVDIYEIERPKLKKVEKEVELDNFTKLYKLVK